MSTPRSRPGTRSRRSGCRPCTVKAKLTNQDGAVLVDGDPRGGAAVLSAVVRGTPLGEEPGLGALSIPGYLREVTDRFAEREALVWRTERGVERWTYATLWQRSVEVARALVACGIGKDGRVGILMTNRPEHLAAAFGTSLAGGVIVPLNTFATPAELEHLLQASSVSTLLFEPRVANKDFAAILRDLEPAIRAAEPGRIRSTRFPFLRRVAMVGDAEPVEGGAIERWGDFLRRGEDTPLAAIDARAATGRSRPTSERSSSRREPRASPKGILHSQRAVAIQWWRWPRLMGVGGRRPQLDGQRLLLVG